MLMAVEPRVADDPVGAMAPALFCPMGADGVYARTALFEQVIEVDERVRADGTVEREPDLAVVRNDLERAKADGITAVAIVFMHAYRYPEHERRIAALARGMGFAQVSVSHEVSPLIKLIGRGDTTAQEKSAGRDRKRGLRRQRARNSLDATAGRRHLTRRALPIFVHRSTARST